MDFLEIFTSCRYRRYMKILKILASNSKRFRVYNIFTKRQIDDDSAWPPDRAWPPFALKPTGIKL